LKKALLKFPDIDDADDRHFSPDANRAIAKLIDDKAFRNL